ncbi:MAG TPA: glycosyl hydrolase family 65 protein [Gaiellaceae bacterium]|nr:glycosyl hydrolase family 65 protein [Gaiellaceae bacterium]
MTETELRLDLLPQTESIFALSNGHIGLRGNLDEGEPHGVPGSYLNGFFESLPLPHAETAYGYPEEGQSLIDVPNGKLMRLLVDDWALDVRYGVLRRHQRRLDLRSGLLLREVEWTTPAGKTVAIRSTRLVSFVHRAVAAVRYEVEALGDPARIVVQSSLVANEPIPERRDDPRAAAALRAPLESEYHANDGVQVALGHRTRVSGLRVAAALHHVVEGPVETMTESESDPDLARVTVTTELQPGETLTVVKLLGYGWSSRRSAPALRDQVDAALSSARRAGWDGLVKAQSAYLDEVWDVADVEIEGDPQLQQALRFAVFQLVQAAARAEQRAIPAKGLTGRGYDGHTFWDMETYTLPMLTYTLPAAARDALLWRHSTLPLACSRARELLLRGAAFPWRTIRGEECSGYWPAATAAFHINADIADATRRYVAATEDVQFEQGPALELLVETARLWCSLGHHEVDGGFHIDGVTGPDEYSALADNNVFTNLMAARNLRAAADVAERWPEQAAEFDVAADEITRWRAAADAVVIPYDAELGVTAQADGFTRYRRWDTDLIGPEQRPLLLHAPYYLLYSSRIVKQADLVFALYLCGDCFDSDQKRRDFDYYEPITVRDSSLSASIQAVVAAEVGRLELAYDYFRETALVDLHDMDGNTADGLHLASLAGAWLVAVAGFGGLRDHGETLDFSPRPPPVLGRLRFRLVYRGRRLRVDMRAGTAVYELLEGDPIEVRHYGTSVRLERGMPLTRDYSPVAP